MAPRPLYLSSLPFETIGFTADPPELVLVAFSIDRMNPVSRNRLACGTC